MFHVTHYVLRNMICVVIIYLIHFTIIKDRTMKLMTVDEYLATHYTPNSRPSRRSLIQQVKRGDMPGKKFGKYYYIDVDPNSSLFHLQSLSSGN